MRRRRLTIGFVLVEGVQGRMLRNMIDGDLSALKGKDRWRGKFWCAADGDALERDASLKLARIYDGTEVPEDACCEECGIALSELQAALKGLGAS